MRNNLVRVEDLEKLGYFKLSQKDKMYVTMGRAMHKSRNPKQISREELYEKVKIAANKIGIENVIITANDRDKGVWFVDDLIRERKYVKFLKDKELNIGYFVKDMDKNVYTIKSFQYNPWVFSDTKARKFLDALRKVNLEPMAHHPLGTIFYTENQIKAWNERKPLYK